MAELILQRLSEHKNVTSNKGKTEDSTIGSLKLVDSQTVLFNGFSCENAGPSTDIALQDKRIMPGIYSLAWSSSKKNGNKALGKWQNKVIWVKRDEAFDKRLIRIHTGNYPSDTEGCILPGESKSTRGYVNSSVNAVIKLFNEIDKLGIENVKLIIKEINNG